MTQALEQAFAEVAKLPDDEQDAFARWILEEMASERRWDEAFAATPDLLARMADAVRFAH